MHRSPAGSRRLAVVGAAVAVLAICAGCSKISTQNAGTGRHSWTVPGELRVAIQNDIKNLNPLLNSNTTDGFIDFLMFEPLLAADPKGNPVPMLAPPCRRSRTAASAATV